MLYRRDRNLSDILVHSANFTRLDAEIFLCRRAYSLPDVRVQTNIRGPKTTHNTFGQFFCQLVNVVYSIMSRRCIVLYIGGTGRRLHERFSEHLRSVRNNYPGFPVAEHFNIASNSLEDIVVCVLKQCSCDNSRCKQQEMHLIFEMSTRWPR